MDNEIIEKTDNCVQIEVTTIEAINYALYQNGIAFIQRITVKNNSNDDLHNAVLSITSEPGFCKPFNLNIDFIPSGKTYEIKNVEVELDSVFLSELTEKIKGTLCVSILKDGEAVNEKTVSITALAFDQWTGYAVYPELLCAFITPNNPYLAKIIARASEFLKEWTGDPSFDGYQTQDPDRVKKQAAAMFCAIKEENIVYSLPPASFEESGQRVRLCDTIHNQKLGTCLDLTLLYASCLEAVGLLPILILQREHIFLGLWLEKITFPESVQDDPSLITKRLASGVNEVTVIESTLMVSGSTASFDDAVEAAKKHFLGTNPIECIIDVKRARLSNITPLPQRVQDDEGWHVENTNEPNSDPAVAPEALSPIIDVSVGTEGENLPKLMQWERKLLDLGLRNNLINLRFTKTIVPVLTEHLDELEDALSSGKDFAVLPRPEGWDAPDEFNFENMHSLGSLTEIVKSEYKNSRLRSVYSEQELIKTMKTLYRNSKVAIEENGTNTLYLALGILRWYETDYSKKPRYAPIVLLPVDIIRQSANKGFSIRLRDDDAQMNITMLERIKQDFSITVPGLDPLPTDENGVDLRKVFTILRKALMDQSRWDILESAYLGQFSFSQFVMWNDLRNRSDEICENKIVKSLIEGKLAWDAEPIDESAEIDEGNVLLPLPADASQLCAIEAACSGQSFVLHGPPGTGKSQTITSLIANALAQNKTVLFVAEKKAALDVVQKRLDAIGIGAFCLELHSNKAKKSEVLKQLSRAIELAGAETPTQYAQKAEQIRQMRENLDFYAKGLHKKQPNGFSLYELINEYEDVKDSVEMPEFDGEYIRKLDANAIEEHIILLERLIAAGKNIGHPAQNPLAPIRATEYSQRLKNDLVNAIEEYKSVLEYIVPSEKLIAGAIEFNEIRTEEGFARLCEIAYEIAKWINIPSSWAQVSNPVVFYKNMKTMAESYQKAAEIKVDLATRWNDSFFDQDGEVLYNSICNANSKWFVPKLIEKNKIVKSLLMHANVSAKEIDAQADITNLYTMHKELAKADKLFEEYGAYLEECYNGDESSWKHIVQLVLDAQVSLSVIKGVCKDAEVIAKVCTEEEYLNAAKTITDNYKAFALAKKGLYELTKIVYPETEDWVATQFDLCQAIVDNKDDIKRILTFNSICQEVEDAGLGSVVELYRNGAKHADVIGAYKKSMYYSLIVQIIDESKVMSSFSGAMFNEKIEQYKRLDADITRLAREELFYRLTSNIPDFTREAIHSSELGVMQKLIKSNGRGTSIRKMFEQLPNILPKLCPCMLMSPISVAQYLDPKREPFDIVVFDEASQLPTCKSVGVLARGRDAVIVGDPKQMPPTSFFAVNTVDEENYEIEDLESILDDCLAINMPQTHLLWHYRSRHESLISFSNNQFYENKLYTFPSFNDRESKLSFVYVEGVFERGKGRQNKQEAQAVVDEIVRRCHDKELSKQSLGVITFNISQQNLIDDMLNKLCETDAELEKWMYESEEPMFIKNLENVQGDEREVILLSVGYGPDENGKVYMNFGPLNREGGWRRLNVAVSRARSEMIVFSSLTHEQINLSKSKSEGVAALKAFLAYAAGNELFVDANTSRQLREIKNGVAKRIKEILKEYGYEAVLSVGHSQYRIDIGVINPNDPEKYILGILLDGPNYGNSKTTRDREVAQVTVLEGLGWSLMRIWTMDWWDNQQYEIKRILDELEKIKNASVEGVTVQDENVVEDNQPDEDAADVSENVDENVDEDENADSPISDYIVVYLENKPLSEEDILSGDYDYNLAKSVRQVIRCEAPIYYDLLEERVMSSFAISEASDKLKGYFADLVLNLHITTTVVGGEMILWGEDDDPDRYYGIRVSPDGNVTRNISRVPLPEIRNAICYVLKEQVSVKKHALIRETEKLLGYKIVEEQYSAIIETIIDVLISDDFIKIDNNESIALTTKGNEFYSVY